MLPSALDQNLGHSFSLYGPPSRQITYMYLKKINKLQSREETCLIEGRISQGEKCNDDKSKQYFGW